MGAMMHIDEWLEPKIRYATTLMALALLLGMSACERPRYDPADNAMQAFQQARQTAEADGKHLMVVFGADWCADCLQLYDNLQSPDVRSYMRDHMDYLTVDVGDKDRNLSLAAELGVKIANGIPVAVFFSPDGSAIGATNDGQLEPSRYLTSGQILKFVQAIVEQRQITRPTVVKENPL